MKKIINVGFAPANEAETPQVNDVTARLQPSGCYCYASNNFYCKEI